MFLSTVIGSHYLSIRLPLFTSIFQIYVGMLIVYKFNMFMPLNIKKIDQDIIFTAGILLLAAQIINIKYIYDYIWNNILN